MRNLERELGKTLRKVATKVAGGDLQPPVAIDEGDVRPSSAGSGSSSRPPTAPRCRASPPDWPSPAWAATYCSSRPRRFPAATPGNSGAALTITGQLGDVMKESAQIALSYVRSHAEALGVPVADRVHLHVPAGAIPKDGPSAGITMVSALASLMTGRPLRSAVGMTGEVTLQGRVLPIGGVKQKVLAASRAGLKEVILPKRNGPDLDDVPQAVKDTMIFHLVEDVTEVLELALEPAPVDGDVVVAGGIDRTTSSHHNVALGPCPPPGGTVASALVTRRAGGSPGEPLRSPSPPARPPRRPRRPPGR